MGRVFPNLTHIEKWHRPLIKKKYTSGSLVSELSLRGRVKTPEEPNNKIRFPHMDRGYHTYWSCRTGVPKKGGAYPL